MHDPGATVTGTFTGADLTPGTVVADRFRIESMVGIGGMGVVYRATDLALDLHVAIKVLRPEVAHRLDALERFRQELLLARKVSSPRVVRIHDIAQHQGRWLISMDLIEGESLERLIDRHGALPLDQALKITRQVAEGLAEAHARNIIHRDLKPSNILIDNNGDACISDFGVALSLDRSGATGDGVIVGTPDYLSPEQIKGGEVDGRSDLYALGLILQEMLTGQQAYAGTTQAESLTRRLVRQPVPASRSRKDIPSWVQQLLNRLLQPRPANRFGNAEAVIRAIDQRRVPIDFRPGRRTGMAAAALVLAAAFAWLGWQRPAPPDTDPPDQVVVLADSAPAGDEAAWAAAVEHVRQALSELPAMAVVDGPRTTQAVAQLGLTDDVRVEPSAVLQLVPARRSLFLSLETGTDGYRLIGELDDGGEERRIEGPAAASFNRAVANFGQELAAAMPAEPLPIDSLLPQSTDSLEAYGAALLAGQAGRFEAALPLLRRATGAAPGYSAAWLALADTALLTGRYELAYQATQQGGASTVLPRMQLHFRALAGLTGEDYEPVAASLRERLESHPDDLSAALRLGELLGEYGEFDSAAEVLNSLLAKDPDEARGWYLLGKYMILQGDARRAVDEYLLRALVLHKRGRNPFGEAVAANALGIGYLRLGQTADAEEQFQHALDLRRPLDDYRGMAATLRNLAQVATFRGDGEEAESFLGEARGMYETLGDQFGLAGIDRQLGLMAEERGDYSSALNAYRRAFRALEPAGDSHDSAEILNDIGFAHYQLGDYDSAQVFWRQASDAFGRLNDPRGVIRANQNLGLLYIMRGRWPEARDLLESTLAESESRQLAEEAAVSRRNLAELEIVQGHLGAAFDQIDRAHELFGELEDQRGLVDVTLLRARALASVGAVEEAESELAGIEESLEQASNEHRAIAALLRSEIARRSGRPADADRALGEAREDAGVSGIAALQLKADVLGESDPDGTLAGVQALSDVPLQLSWYHLALERLAAAGEYEEAARQYAAAAALTEGLGDYVGAFELHRLGADALAESGAASEAETARQAAATALQRLVAGTPQQLQAFLENDPDVIAFRKTEQDD